MSALKKALLRLPKTLDETYDRIIQGLESAGQLQDAITVLRWLCFSKVPLYLSEMIEVLAIENGDSGGFCPDERLPNPADIMVICSSLISCGHTDKKTRKPQIRLAHFSVKEYLLSDRCILTLDFQKATCHMAMAESCLHYLLYLYENLPLTKELVFQHPLSRYAAVHWWQHARAADHPLNPTVINLSCKLLMNKDASVLPWVQLFNIDYPRRPMNLSLTLDDVAPPLYYAASTGLLQVMEDIMSRTVDINAKGGRSHSALQVACYHGYEKVIEKLLDAGADVNAGGSHNTALQLASRHGNENLVQILLDAGADANAQKWSCRTALQRASMNGYEKIVQILLDAGVNVNAEGKYGTALQWASINGHEKVVRMLLDAGADVKYEGKYDTALQSASEQGHEKVVRILLDAGANVNAEAKYGTALQIASRHGHENIVQILLDAGADVNAVAGFWGTALQAASQWGGENIVQILLDAGAKPETEE